MSSLTQESTAEESHPHKAHIWRNTPTQDPTSGGTPPQRAHWGKPSSWEPTAGDTINQQHTAGEIQLFRTPQLSERSGPEAHSWSNSTIISPQLEGHTTPGVHTRVKHSAGSTQQSRRVHLENSPTQDPHLEGFNNPAVHSWRNSPTKSPQLEEFNTSLCHHFKKSATELPTPTAGG